MRGPGFSERGLEDSDGLRTGLETSVQGEEPPEASNRRVSVVVTTTSKEILVGILPCEDLGLSLPGRDGVETDVG